ncbi:hypothetical protein ACROYT_G029403 [Oculina patagonica]
MTPLGQCREDAQELNKPLMTPRTQIRIGNWNVRTMYTAGNVAQVVRLMNQMKVQIMGISECRWIGAGTMKLSSGETVLYSGRDYDQHMQGVAIMMTPEDYVVKMEINSLKLNMKLVLEFTEDKDSADVNSTPNGNRTPKYGKIHKGKKYMYGRNDSTCPEYKPFISRLPGVIYPLSWRQDMTTKISWHGWLIGSGMEFNG